MVYPLWRTVWRLLKKLKIELPYDPAIPLLGVYSEKTIFQKDTCTPIFTVALFTIAKTWKKPNYPSIKEWIKKMWYIYIYIYIYIYTHTYIHTNNRILVIKKSEIMSFAAT